MMRHRQIVNEWLNVAKWENHFEFDEHEEEINTCDFRVQLEWHLCIVHAGGPFPYHLIVVARFIKNRADIFTP